MKTLKSLLVLAVLVLATTTVVAQPRPMQRGAGPDVELPAEFLATLNLTDAQKAQLFDLRVAHAKESQAMREASRSGDVAPNALREMRQAIRAKHDNELKSILNDEQYKKMTEFRAERQEKMRELREDRPVRGQRGANMPRNGQRPGGGNRGN
jgi:Spy/CpxP family protein refolding chaperone